MAALPRLFLPFIEACFVLEHLCLEELQWGWIEQGFLLQVATCFELNIMCSLNKEMHKLYFVLYSKDWLLQFGVALS
jgi:hypothetical protein